jgi:hypothetical protein
MQSSAAFKTLDKEQLVVTSDMSVKTSRVPVVDAVVMDGEASAGDANDDAMQVECDCSDAVGVTQQTIADDLDSLLASIESAERTRIAPSRIVGKIKSRLAHMGRMARLEPFYRPCVPRNLGLEPRKTKKTRLQKNLGL